jgi:branched-chain amino acid transport system permease protein
MNSWLKNIITAVVILAVLYVINMLLSKTGFFGIGIDDYQGRLVVFIAINVILATSLNLINGFTGQFSIGHAGFMAVGAYSSAYFTVNYGAAIEKAISSEPGGVVSSGIVLLIAVTIGAAVAAIAGLIVGIPSLRLKGDYLAIVTLGFAEIIRIVILNIDAVGGATGYAVPGYANFMWIGVFAVLTVVVVHNIVKSDTGRALVSIREDELAAEAMGVNTTRYKVTAFVISSAFAGVAGVLFAHYNKFLSTNDFQFIRSFEVIIMIVLGGLGSMSGAIIGAVVVTILPELLRRLAFINVPFIQVLPNGDVLLSSIPLDSLRLVIFALILILTMILRPQGIFGTREFGLSWLKRPRTSPEGTEAVGGTGGVPIAEDQDAKHMTSEGDDK